MEKLSLLTLLLAMLMAIVAACGSRTMRNQVRKEIQPRNETQSEAVAVKHKLGTTKVKTNPEKVVVFDIGMLDTLD